MVRWHVLSGAEGVLKRDFLGILYLRVFVASMGHLSVLLGFVEINLNAYSTFLFVSGSFNYFK